MSTHLAGFLPAAPDRPHPLSLHILSQLSAPIIFFRVSAREIIFLNAYLLIITFFWLKAWKALSSSRHVLWLPSLVHEDLPGLMVPQIYHIPHSLLAILENFGFAVSYKFISHTCVVLSTWNVAPPLLCPSNFYSSFSIFFLFAFCFFFWAEKDLLQGQARRMGGLYDIFAF